jgi:hypothetical protein
VEALTFFIYNCGGSQTIENVTFEIIRCELRMLLKKNFFAVFHLLKEAAMHLCVRIVVNLIWTQTKLKLMEIYPMTGFRSDLPIRRRFPWI